MTTDFYKEAHAILDRCAAGNCGKEGDRNNVISKRNGPSRSVHGPCWNSYVYARRAARKLELAAHNASLPVCDRCGKKPLRWTLAGFSLCTACKKATFREHNRASADLGAGAILAALSGAFMVDTAAWACNRRERERS